MYGIFTYGVNVGKEIHEAFGYGDGLLSIDRKRERLELKNNRARYERAQMIQKSQRSAPRRFQREVGRR